MPDLLRIQTEHFELSVWCNDIVKRQKVHTDTIRKRESKLDSVQNKNKIDATSVMRFSPALTVKEAVILDNKIIVDGLDIELLSFIEPLFFENVQYQFEWLFFDNIEQAYLAHRVKAVNDGFRFSKGKGSIPARLTGTINTGNDVGWMRLPLCYLLAGKEYRCNFTFEVLPTKMDLHSDLPAMYQAIDETYPLWRFSFAEKTEQDVAKGKQKGHFPLLWLANFGTLREQFEKGLKVITQAPHSRLQTKVSYTRAIRLKGRVSHHLSSRVKEDFSNGIFEKRYRIEKKQLSVDTPENRFIKAAISKCKKQLTEFDCKLRENNKTPDNQRLSDTFLTEINSWQKPLHKILNQSFMKEVGPYNGLSHESLVLQQKTGYSTVYRVWQELKFYLDVFSSQSSISMKSISEIYEVWCFLELRKILINDLGFKDKTSKRKSLVLNDYLEYQLKDGFAGAFEFEREDGFRAKLAHEPIFGKKSNDILSYLVTQKPDIVLEVQLPQPSDKRFVWLFDAKYRIKTQASRFEDEDTDNADYVPDDAINQMHRYRDALIRISRNSSSNIDSKSRPVFGAFALYPGFFDQESDTNPYKNAISEIGIGAFAMLPSGNGKTSCYWLRNFLTSQLGVISQNGVINYSAQSLNENLYVQEAARIPYYGMKQSLYSNLIMTIALGGKRSRNDEYFSGFDNGTAKWYHLPKKTFLNEFKLHIAKEIQFLALASTSDSDSKSKSIDKIWPIKNMTLVARGIITKEQSGKTSDSDELYYLFELGKPLLLKDTIKNVPHRPISKSMKLTTLTLLECTHNFSDIKSVYTEALT
ncbi:restriction endonuclease-like protein [Oceanisphaera arctica]|uniref:DUF2357 domain-containing protein n=1 Tax=Oceanisphaera arctica TaxID=641510 RepID=A0A2P5TJN4_9GAMM|nr:restriction endonuclease-like protein [Oceanisphaera arctica]PPL15239.1 hypothetical protein UN63_13310 [Oceanisphaera arctica]GHA28091.1 hypothetical protein GCM10007082_30420 [Oceanisphaera arctica]